jgi:hypothetical protein
MKNWSRNVVPTKEAIEAKEAIYPGIIEAVQNIERDILLLLLLLLLL